MTPKGSGLDKRQATLQLCIRAEGDQIVRLAIIFRGQGLRLSAEEKALYRSLSTLLQVYFQPSAWADGQIMMKWLEQFAKDTAAELAGQEILLGMDNHGAQQTTLFRDCLFVKHVQPAYTPPDCTDVASPCDHHVGLALKIIMGWLYHHELENNQSEWCGPANGLTTSKRRMLMATWAAAAWAVVRQDASFLRSAFTSTGFLFAKDGSENDLIKVPGVPDYDFLN